MTSTIFYSWQSDLPNSTNRGFLESVLEQAIKAVTADGELAEDIELDKDTKGVPGTPPITDVILDKISNCTVFVPDMSFVGSTRDDRLLPNSNVLIEYGWALRSVGYFQIVPIMNTAYGEVSMENLPFNMRHLRHPLTYSLAEGASPEDKAEVKRDLIKQVSEAIRAILDNNIQTAPVVAPAPHVPVPSTLDPSTFLEEDEALGSWGRIGDQDRELFLPTNEHMYLRLLPTNDEEGIRSTKQANELLTQSEVLPLLGDLDIVCPGRNKHGAYVADHCEGSIRGLTQLFLNKELWGIDAVGVDKKDCTSRDYVRFGYIPCVYLEKTYIATLSSYLRFCRDVLELKPPLKMMVGMTGVKGYKMAVPDKMSSGGREKLQRNVPEDNIEHESIIEDLNRDPFELLRPFFEKVWEECDLTRPVIEGR